MEIGGNTYPIVPVENLNAHNINRYKIHGGKCVPVTKNSKVPWRMEANELYEIETFATTGDGIANEHSGCSHYALNPAADLFRVALQGSKDLLNLIR